MECLGGSGYVEESVMPRLFRESPLNSIWEGCGNIQSLDILRALGKSPAAAEALFNEIELSGGADKQLDNFVEKLKSDIFSNNVTEGLPEAWRRVLQELHRHHSWSDTQATRRQTTFSQLESIRSTGYTVLTTRLTLQPASLTIVWRERPGQWQHARE